MSETKGVGGRGMFFDGNGTLRDVMQNHMLAMAALTGMEQPRNFSAEEVRNARCAFIKSLQDISSNKITHDIIRGQYVGGVVQGEAVVGYKQEKDIETTSDTETFVAMRLYVNTPRWKGVPWYLRAGKRLRKNAVEISIVFRQTCHILFKEYGCPEEGNILTIRVAPDEGIGIRFIAKAPASRFSLKAVDMDFAYAEAFNATDTMDAYEHILIDAFNGDQMIFNRTDELEESWEYITTILRAWEMQKVIPVPYASGSWGPQAAIDLIEKDGREWIIK
jgi:glucose-6-phosphate 1-dehydrogenase